MLERRRLGAAAFLLALLFHAVVGVKVWRWSVRPADDFDRYYAIATGSGRPYLDYDVEHPIATLGLFKALASGTGGRAAFGARIVLVNVAADLTIVTALAWGWGVTAAAVFAMVIVPLADLLFNRIDLWSMACASVAVAMWRRDRRAVSAIAVGLGAAFKLWPLVFAVLLVVPPPGSTRGRTPDPIALCVFAATGAIIGAIWWLVAGNQGLYQVLTFRGARGWQIESSVGALLHLAGARTLRMESGSWRIGSTTGPISMLLLASSATAALWGVWRGARTNRVGTGWLAGVATLLVLSPLLSAQFAGWLAPGIAMAWAEGDRRHAAMAAAAVALTVVFWSSYGAVLDGERVMLAVVVARNVCLAAVATSAIALLAGPGSPALSPEAK